jgi:glutaredoxin
MKTQVIIYSRPGCHLCEEAKQSILKAGLTEQYMLTEVNITDDPELLARYKDDIPVITFDGVEAFRHRVSSVDFAAALEQRRVTRREV